MNLKIETNFPMSVKEMTYARNHHWFKLTDKDGNETTLLENGIVMYSCNQCDEEWYTQSKTCSFCPRCASDKIKSMWTSPQIALIPQNQSDFEMPGD